MGLAKTCRAVRLHHHTPVWLLLVRDLDHVDFEIQPEEVAGQRKGRAPLSGSGLGSECLGASCLVEEGLRDGCVGFVTAGRRNALVLVVNMRRSAKCFFQPAGAQQRRRPVQFIDLTHFIGYGDEPLRRDLLQDQFHWEQDR